MEDKNKNKEHIRNKITEKQNNNRKVINLYCNVTGLME